MIMKKTALTLLAILLVAFGNATQAQTIRNAPQKIANYVAKHFPNNPIVDYEKDSDDRRVKYEVELRDGTDLEFNHRMNVIKIDSDSDSRPLPASVVPASILSHLKTNFPGAYVVKLEKKRYGYEVELNNDLELKFNNKGKLLKIDD